MKKDFRLGKTQRHSSEGSVWVNLQSGHMLALLCFLTQLYSALSAIPPLDSAVSG